MENKLTVVEVICFYPMSLLECIKNHKINKRFSKNDEQNITFLNIKQDVIEMKGACKEDIIKSTVSGVVSDYNIYINI